MTTGPAEQRSRSAACSARSPPAARLRQSRRASGGRWSGPTPGSTTSASSAAAPNTAATASTHTSPWPPPSSPSVRYAGLPGCSTAGTPDHHHDASADLLAGALNHVGRDFPRFREVLEQGPDSPAASWFHIDASRPGPDGFGYRDFEGHSALVALDHRNPDVADHVAHVMTYWCDRGVDAWRLHAAYAVPPAFWRDVLPRVRDRHPDLWVVGEVLHGDYTGYVAESGVGS